MLRLVRYLAWFAAGSAVFAATGRTPQRGYQAMRDLVTAFGPRFVAAASAVATLRRRRARTTAGDGVFGHIDAEGAAGLARRIEGDGFVVFDARLDEATCAELEQLARRTPARPLPRPADAPEQLVYDPAHPVATRYDLDEPDILSSPAAQRIATDPSVRAVAAAYLGCEPVNDLVAMWWTVAHGERPSSEAAQLFHTDRDRLRFLKFFFYLTDVTPQTGPHVFVRGSHRNAPARLREDRRFADDEVLAAYGVDAVVEIPGARGTILAVDTSGLHKGKHPEVGDRLLLQLEYANSLLGAPYETLPAGLLVDDAARAVAAAPRTFRRFTRGQ